MLLNIKQDNCKNFIFLFFFSNYTLYISKTIRPGFEITFTINLLSGTNPVELTCSLKSKDYAFSKTVNSTIEVGKTNSFALCILKPNFYIKKFIKIM